MLGQYTVISSMPVIDLGPHKDTVLNLYFTFLIIGGNVCLPLLTATVVFMKSANRRHPTLANFFIAWTTYATACLILLYSGEQHKTNPKFDVCLAQAALIYGSISAGTVATFCLVLHLWLDFKCRKICGNSLLSISLLLAAPWAFFTFFVILAIVTGVKSPSTVTNQWVFYCTVSSPYIVYSVSAVGLVMITLVLVFQGLIHSFLYKVGKVRAVDQSSFQLSIQVTIFTLFSVLFFIVDIVDVFKPTKPAAYLVFSVLPLTIFMVFGTQKENLRLWFRLRRRPGRQTYLKPITFNTPTIQRSNPTSTTRTEIEKPLPPIPHLFAVHEHV